MWIPVIPPALEEGLYFAMRLDYVYCRGFVLIRSWLGVYDSPDQRRKVCHPLESVVLRHPVADEKLEQIAKAIGVGRPWVDGFIDSLMGLDVAPGAADAYQEGYCLARWPDLRKKIEPLVEVPPPPPPLFLRG